MKIDEKNISYLQAKKVYLNSKSKIQSIEIEK